MGPAAPLDRLRAAGVLCAARQAELTAHRDSLDPVKITRGIAELRTRLLVVAKGKTEQLYLAGIPSALPDVGEGVHVTAS